MKDQENNIDYISLQHRDTTKEEVNRQSESCTLWSLSSRSWRLENKAVDAFHQPTSRYSARSSSSQGRPADEPVSQDAVKPALYIFNSTRPCEKKALLQWKRHLISSYRASSSWAPATEMVINRHKDKKKKQTEMRWFPWQRVCQLRSQR